MSTIARNPHKIWRVIDLLKWGEQYFSDNDFDNPRKEIEILLQDVLGCNRVDLYLRFEEPLGKNQLKYCEIGCSAEKTENPYNI